jgi:hypothetical protein
VAKSKLGQSGNSAIPGFSWQTPVTNDPTVIAPGMAPQFPVVQQFPIEKPFQPTLVHGLPVSVAKRIHNTLLFPEKPVTEATLFPRANRGQRPQTTPVDGVRVPVYNPDTGAPRVDQFGKPVTRVIPYLGGDRLIGPFAGEFKDPGPAQWAAEVAAKKATITPPAWKVALQSGQTWQGPHGDVPAGFVPPVNPTKARQRIRGNKGIGPARGGVKGKTPLSGQ